MNRNPPKTASRIEDPPANPGFNCPLRYGAVAKFVIGWLQRLLSAAGFTYCVVFATLQNLFFTATVQDDFLGWMSRIYYRWGVAFMKSLVVKRSVVVAGHKTSVSLEDAFWKELREIAAERHVKVSELAHTISAERENSNLSSAIRLFVLEFYRKQISAHQEKQTRNHAA